jgi:hypothetical protein
MRQNRTISDFDLAFGRKDVQEQKHKHLFYGTDQPPGTSPPSKLDLGPLEVHSTEQN